MHLQELYAIQKELNERIVAQHQLNSKDLKQEKLLALLTEIGELANETRCFKYWSTKAAAPRERILEEYVDCLHFILTIGLDNGYEDVTADASEEELSLDLTSQFINLYLAVNELANVTSKESFHLLLQDFFTLGRRLSFSQEEVKQAYLAKNQQNHRRQDENY